MGFICRICGKQKMETVESTIRHIFQAYGLILRNEEDRKLLGRFIYEELF